MAREGASYRYVIAAFEFVAASREAEQLRGILAHR
jgi:hypothetical protein